MTRPAPAFETSAPPWLAASPPETAVTEARPGGFWRRVFALLIDAAIIWILLRVGDAAVAALGRWDLLARAFDPTWRLVVPAAYFVLCHGSGGRTLGKAAAGVRVVLVTGQPLGYVTALVRYLAWFLSVLTLGIGFLLVAARSDKRALHDVVAGTRVVRRGDG